MNENQDKIIVFQEKEIRRIWHHEEWWFSVIDIVGVLSESQNSRRYWSDLKRKLKVEGFDEVYEKIVQLRMESPRPLERSCVPSVGCSKSLHFEQ